MEFAFTPEQELFKQEVRAFFHSEEVLRLLDEVNAAPPREEVHPQQIYRWLGERGWLAVNWPARFGGLGKTVIEAAVVSEEMCLAGVPDTVHINSIDIVGLFLLLAGTEHQKQRFLPPMARGEMIASVLYSEPDSGSDLSSLTTRAEFDGQAYVIWGRKIFSLKTQLADYGLCAVRTKKSQTNYDGITLFMVPLRAPGVQITPYWNMTDERFNEVVLDGVRVGAEEIIGQLHDGWRLINAALTIERTGMDYYARMRHWLNAIVVRARATGQIHDVSIGERIAAVDAYVEAGRLMAWRMITQLSQGRVDEVTAAMSKWHNTETGRGLIRLVLEMEGMEGILSRWDDDVPMDGLLESAYREIPALSISAGTSEIMLYLIAASGLRTFE